MAITLGGASSREPYWLDIGGFADLRLKVRPLESGTVFLVNRKVDRQLERLVETRAELIGLGGDVSALPDLADDDQVSAFRSVLFLVALGQAAIVDWAGVFGADGAAAPVKDDTVAELMRTYPVGVRFRDAYLAEHIVRSAEKNVSAPSPAGISASAPAGAGAAAPGADNARAGGGAADVPTEPAAPRPPKA